MNPTKGKHHAKLDKAVSAASTEYKGSQRTFYSNFRLYFRVILVHIGIMPVYIDIFLCLVAR